MAALLGEWVNKLGLPTTVTSFERDLANGVVLAEVLLLLGLASSSLADGLKHAQSSSAKAHNFRLLAPALKKIGVTLSAKTTRDIATEQRGAAAKVLYQIRVYSEGQAPSGGRASSLSMSSSVDAAPADDAAAPLATTSARAAAAEALRDPKKRAELEFVRKCLQQGMSKKQVAEALHLKKFEDVRVAREERLKLREEREQAALKEQQAKFRESALATKAGNRAFLKEWEASGKKAWRANQRSKQQREQRELQFELTMATRRAKLATNTRARAAADQRRGIEEFEAIMARTSVPEGTDDGDLVAAVGTLPAEDPMAYLARVQAATADGLKPRETAAYHHDMKQRTRHDRKARKERDTRQQKQAVDQARMQAEVDAAVAREAELQRYLAVARAERTAAAQLWALRAKKAGRKDQSAVWVARQDVKLARAMDDAMARDRQAMRAARHARDQTEAAQRAEREQLLAAAAAVKRDRHVMVCEETANLMVDVVLEVIDWLMPGKYDPLSGRGIPHAEWRRVKDEFVSGKLLVKRMAAQRAADMEAKRQQVQAAGGWGIILNGTVVGAGVLGGGEPSAVPPGGAPDATAAAAPRGAAGAGAGAAGAGAGAGGGARTHAAGAIAVGTSDPMAIPPPPPPPTVDPTPTVQDLLHAESQLADAVVHQEYSSMLGRFSVPESNAAQQAPPMPDSGAAAGGGGDGSASLAGSLGAPTPSASTVAPPDLQEGSSQQRSSDLVFVEDGSAAKPVTRKRSRGAAAGDPATSAMLSALNKVKANPVADSVRTILRQLAERGRDAADLTETPPCVMGVVVDGPPVSGKTGIATGLARLYNLRHITPADTVAAALRHFRQVAEEAKAEGLDEPATVTQDEALPPQAADLQRTLYEVGAFAHAVLTGADDPAAVAEAAVGARFAAAAAGGKGGKKAAPPPAQGEGDEPFKPTRTAVDALLPTALLKRLLALTCWQAEQDALALRESGPGASTKPPAGGWLLDGAPMTPAMAAAIEFVFRTPAAQHLPDPDMSLAQVIAAVEGGDWALPTPRQVTAARAELIANGGVPAGGGGKGGKGGKKGGKGATDGGDPVYFDPLVSAVELMVVVTDSGSDTRAPRAAGSVLDPATGQAAADGVPYDFAGRDAAWAARKDDATVVDWLSSVSAVVEVDAALPPARMLGVADEAMDLVADDKPIREAAEAKAREEARAAVDAARAGDTDAAAAAAAAAAANQSALSTHGSFRSLRSAADSTAGAFNDLGFNAEQRKGALCRAAVRGYGVDFKLAKQLHRQAQLADASYEAAVQTILHRIKAVEADNKRHLQHVGRSILRTVRGQNPIISKATAALEEEAATAAAGSAGGDTNMTASIVSLSGQVGSATAALKAKVAARKARKTPALKQQRARRQPSVVHAARLSQELVGGLKRRVLATKPEDLADPKRLEALLDDVDEAGSKLWDVAEAKRDNSMQVLEEFRSDGWADSKVPQQVDLYRALMSVEIRRAVDNFNVMQRYFEDLEQDFLQERMPTLRGAPVEHFADSTFDAQGGGSAAAAGAGAGGSASAADADASAKPDSSKPPKAPKPAASKSRSTAGNSNGDDGEHPSAPDAARTPVHKAPKELEDMVGEDDVLVLNARPARRPKPRPKRKKKKPNPALMARHWAAAAQACMFALTEGSDLRHHWKAAAKACLFANRMGLVKRRADQLDQRLKQRRPSQMEELAMNLARYPDLQSSFRRGVAAIDGMLDMLSKLAKSRNSEHPSVGAFAAALATEVLLVSRRLSGIASAAVSACDALTSATDKLFKECEGWIGDRARSENRNIMALVSNVQNLLRTAAGTGHREDPVTVSSDTFVLQDGDNIATTSVGYGIAGERNALPGEHVVPPVALSDPEGDALPPPVSVAPSPRGSSVVSGAPSRASTASVGSAPPQSGAVPPAAATGRAAAASMSAFAAATPAAQASAASSAPPLASRTAPSVGDVPPVAGSGARAAKAVSKKPEEDKPEPVPVGAYPLTKQVVDWVQRASGEPNPVEAAAASAAADALGDSTARSGVSGGGDSAAGGGARAGAGGGAAADESMGGGAGDSLPPTVDGGQPDDDAPPPQVEVPPIDVPPALRMTGPQLAEAVSLIVSTIVLVEDAVGEQCSAAQALRLVSQSMALPGAWHALTSRAFADLAALLSPGDLVDGRFTMPNVPDDFEVERLDGVGAAGRPDVVMLVLPLLTSLLRQHPAPPQLLAMVGSLRRLDTGLSGSLSASDFASAQLWFQFTPEDAAAVVLGKPATEGPNSDLARRLAFYTTTWDDREADAAAVRDVLWTVWGDTNGKSLQYHRLVLDLAADLRGWEGVNVAPGEGDAGSGDGPDAPPTSSWVDVKASGVQLPSAIGLFKSFLVADALQGRSLFWGPPMDLTVSRSVFLDLVAHDTAKGLAAEFATPEAIEDELGSEESVRLGDLLLTVSVAGGEESALETWMVTKPYEMKDVFAVLATHLHQ